MSCGRIIVIVERHTSLSTTPNALDNSIRQKQWQDGEAASIKSASYHGAKQAEVCHAQI
jgi:hypothetical protein